MTESHLYWFVHHGSEEQTLVLVKAPAEAHAWELLAESEGGGFLDWTKKNFALDAVTSLVAESCILGVCIGDEYGLTVEPNECTNNQ